MSTAKVIKVIGSSTKSQEDAIEEGLKKASKTVHGISGMKVVDWTIDVKDNKVAAHNVTLEIAFRVDE